MDCSPLVKNYAIPTIHFLPPNLNTTVATTPVGKRKVDIISKWVSCLPSVKEHKSVPPSVIQEHSNDIFAHNVNFTLRTAKVKYCTKHLNLYEIQFHRKFGKSHKKSLSSVRHHCPAKSNNCTSYF